MSLSRMGLSVHDSLADGSEEKVFRSRSCDMIKIDQMVLNKKYPNVRAKRVNTQYGRSVLLTVEDSPEKLVKVFLPNR